MQFRDKKNKILEISINVSFPFRDLRVGLDMNIEGVFSKREKKPEKDIIEKKIICNSIALFKTFLLRRREGLLSSE